MGRKVAEGEGFCVQAKNKLKATTIRPNHLSAFPSSHGADILSVTEKERVF
jgi:hypothetical protein